MSEYTPSTPRTTVIMPSAPERRGDLEGHTMIPEQGAEMSEYMSPIPERREGLDALDGHTTVVMPSAPEQRNGLNQVNPHQWDEVRQAERHNEGKPKLSYIFQAQNALAGAARVLEGGDRKSTRLNSSHIPLSRMPSSA